jgi:hypothetical protein
MESTRSSNYKFIHTRLECVYSNNEKKSFEPMKIGYSVYVMDLSSYSRSPRFFFVVEIDLNQLRHNGNEFRVRPL